MKIFQIAYSDRHTLPDRLEALAAERDITVEQLIRRFIAQGVAEIDGDSGPSIPGTSLEDYLVKNDVLKPENNRSLG
nr:hypothetical protein [uncultured Halomonas sp.]